MALRISYFSFQTGLAKGDIFYRIIYQNKVISKGNVAKHCPYALRLVTSSFQRIDVGSEIPQWPAS
jgi:hypothetical protein